MMLPKKQFKKSISYDEWKARAEAAEKRVAELEAAQAWRPVTEPPTMAGDYLGYECDGARRVVVVAYDPDLDGDDSWPWNDWYGDSVPITHWWPIPPLPTGDK